MSGKSFNSFENLVMIFLDEKTVSEIDSCSEK